jgi:hypothetical protein
MDGAKSHAVHAAASERAREYRAQADAYRRLAAGEPLDQKRRLLILSASKYDEAADCEERLVSDRRRDEHRWLGREAPREVGL